jgi:hypothetical protein
MEPIKIGDGTIERDWGISVVAPGKHAMWFHESGQKQQLSAKNCKAPPHQVAANDRMTRCTVRWTVPVAASKSPALALRQKAKAVPFGES